MPATAAVHFIESMECLPVAKLPEGVGFSYELKIDGYRVQIVKNAGRALLYSRRKSLLNDKYPYIAEAFPKLPDGTIMDGELVALNDEGYPVFGLLQNFKTQADRIRYVAFDLLALKGKSLIEEPLSRRRELLARVLPKHPRLSLSAYSPTLDHILSFVTEHHLEGVIAKKTESAYEPGQRSGTWQKHRLNRGQEFVVGGYTQGTKPFDALVVGFYDGKMLLYSGRVRAGFVSASRCEIFKRMAPLAQKECPFANLPEHREGRWGQGLTAEKMNCVWVKPSLVVRIDFLEWTDAAHLRHPKYIGVRDDKQPKKVVREAT